MRKVLSVLSVVALACILLLSVAPAGQAADKLDQYRIDGVVAERYDGYTETRGSAPADAAALVKDVNRQRREIYEKRAREQNVPVEAVGGLFAQKIMQQAPSGTYFRTQDGKYVRK